MHEPRNMPSDLKIVPNPEPGQTDMFPVMVVGGTTPIAFRSKQLAQNYIDLERVYYKEP